MLNPSILDGIPAYWMAGKTYTGSKIHHLAKAATITGEHPETRVKEDEAPNEVIGLQHQRLRGILQLS